LALRVEHSGRIGVARFLKWFDWLICQHPFALSEVEGRP